METLVVSRVVALGVFDPVSAHEVRELQRLGAVAGSIVVGVISDAEATALCGHAPAMRAEDRAEIISHVRGVGSVAIVDRSGAGIIRPTDTVVALGDSPEIDLRTGNRHGQVA